MNKSIVFALIFFSLSFEANAQACYQVIGNLTGSNLLVEDEELSNAACSLRDSLPAEFQDDFKVVEFGFYRLGNSMTGGLDRVWNSVSSQVENNSDYFVLFGTEISNASMGVNRIKIMLPNVNSMSCITDGRMEGVENECQGILNQLNKSDSEKKIEVLELVGKFISRTINCCGGSGTREQRYSSYIDTSILQIGVCFDNCGLNYIEEDEIAIIENNEMPVIGFKIIYPEALIISCSELFVRFSVKYVKDVNGVDRDRDDVFTKTFDEVLLNDYLQIDFDSIQVFDVQWPLIQGGRAKIEILENRLSPTPIKTFDFTIKAHNPNIATVMEHLQGAPYDDFWFFKRLIMHESGTFAQNVSAEMKQFNSFNASSENLHETWEAFSRCPNASANNDGGFGLTQLTNPIPSSQALWDWKCNVYGAYDLLVNEKRTIVNAVFDDDFMRLDEWNNNPVNENDAIEKVSLDYAGVTWSMSESTAFGDGYERINSYFNDDLEEGERSYLDACLLVAYNGFGGMNNNNFLHLSSGSDMIPKPQWMISDNQNNYVEEVVTQQVPAPY